MKNEIQNSKNGREIMVTSRMVLSAVTESWQTIIRSRGEVPLETRIALRSLIA